MNRLTEKDDQGNWGLKGIRWEQLYDGQVITREIWWKLYIALCKLMEYEDTGMDPEEVGKLRYEQDKHRWIPVTERLPEEGVDCLVTVQYSGFMGIHGKWIKTGHLRSYGKWWGDCVGGHVMAWQPLPKPYIPVPNQDNSAGGWQEQMTSTFLGDSRL